MTPVWLAGVFALVPGLGFLRPLAFLYAVYVFWLGLPILMKSPSDGRAPYALASIVSPSSCRSSSRRWSDRCSDQFSPKPSRPTLWRAAVSWAACDVENGSRRRRRRGSLRSHGRRRRFGRFEPAGRTRPPQPIEWRNDVALSDGPAESRRRLTPRQATMPSQSSVAPTPARLLQFSWGFAVPLIVDAAIRCRLFDALDRGPRPPPRSPPARKSPNAGRAPCSTR